MFSVFVEPPDESDIPWIAVLLELRGSGAGRQVRCLFIWLERYSERRMQARVLWIWTSTELRNAIEIGIVANVDTYATTALPSKVVDGFVE